MLCSKCNTEIPEGARFCPACGQKSELSLPKKCSSCGLELEQNTKFCPICGTPVESAPAATTSAQPAAPASSIPQPVNSIPRPVPRPSDFSFSGTAPAPKVDLNKGTSSAYQTPDSGIAADTAQPSAFPDYGFSDASSVVATRIKKSGASVGAIIGIAAAGVIAVLVGVFLLNKGSVMNLFMGNKGYAAMIESKTVDAVTDAVASPLVTSSVESLSGTFATTMANAAEDVSEGDFDADEGLDYSNGVNFSALIANADLIMKETYGTNAVSVSVTPYVELTDTAKSLLVGEGDTAEVDEVVSAINGISFAGSFSTGKDIIGTAASISEGGFNADAKMLMTADGKIYMSFPFGSDKSVMIPIEQADNAAEDVPALALEEEEIERLADKIGEIYLDYYKNGEITVENDGELTAAGASAKGKLISVDIKGGQLSDMFAEIGNTIAEDEYFRTKIVAYAVACGEDLTEDEYKQEIKDAFTFEGADTDILRVQTVVNKNNEVLAKCITAIDDDESVSFAYIDGKDTAACEVIENGTTLLAANITKTDEENGSANLKVSDGESYPIAVKVDYADIKTEKFLKTDVTTGTYTISVTPPADFTADDPYDEELYTILAQSKFVLSFALNGSTYEETFTFDCPQYGIARLTAKVSADAAFDLTVPANVIDISGIMEGEVDDAATAELDQMIADIVEKAKSCPDSYIAQAIVSAAEGSNDDYDYDFDPDYDPDYEPDVPAVSDALNEQINALRDTCSADLDVLYDLYYDHYTFIEDNYYSEYEDLQLELYDIYSRTYNVTEENDVLALEKVLKETEADVNAFVSKIESEDEGYSESYSDSSNVSVLPEYDYDSLTYDELIDAMMIAEEYYLDLCIRYSASFTEDSEVYELFEDCSENYNEVYEDLLDLNDAAEHGTLSIPLLREARKSAAKFDESLRALADALENSAA